MADNEAILDVEYRLLRPSLVNEIGLADSGVMLDEECSCWDLLRLVNAIDGGNHGAVVRVQLLLGTYCWEWDRCEG